MNIILWVLQIGLAIHTVIGAVWKLSNSEQTVPSLEVIPHGVWRSLSILEVLFALGLVLPAFTATPAILAPIAAICIGAEMLLFSGLQAASGEKHHGEITYWLVVALVCAIVAVGRFVWTT